MAETIGARERGRITPDEGAVLAAETARNADFGKPVLIYPNLYLVRVPLPHNPLRALNSYFILDDDGTTTIVDVGFNHPDCEQALDDALAALGRSWDKVQVVLTHSHPDHTGNLDRIWREGMPVLANLHSFQEVKNLMEIEDNVYGPLLLQAATLEQQRDLTFDEKGPRLHVSAELLPLSTYPVMTYLADGDCLKVGEFEFEVIETPGHDPWHICLYEAAHKILLSGDHVLERITPSVSSWFPAYNALAEFLESLEKVGGYDVDRAGGCRPRRHCSDFPACHVALPRLEELAARSEVLLHGRDAGAPHLPRARGTHPAGNLRPRVLLPHALRPQEPGLGAGDD